MASGQHVTPSPDQHMPVRDEDLLLRETNHRCSNDLQLVVSLLALQSRRAGNDEVRQALSDAMERVSVLARSRRAMHQERHQSLEAALRQVCEALHAQAEPRGILISLMTAHEALSLSSHQITILALVVNELATNAIKHAFEEEKAGHIRAAISRNGNADVIIIVDDDGLPFPENNGNDDGLGLGLAKRLMASIGGLFIPPPTDRRYSSFGCPLNMHEADPTQPMRPGISAEAAAIATDLAGRYGDMALGRARMQLYAALNNREPAQVDLLAQACHMLMEH